MHSTPEAVRCVQPLQSGRHSLLRPSHAQHSRGSQLCAASATYGRHSLLRPRHAQHSRGCQLCVASAAWQGLPPAQQPWSGGAAWPGSAGCAWLSVPEPGSRPQLQRGATAVRCRGPHLHHHMGACVPDTGVSAQGRRCRGPHLQHQMGIEQTDCHYVAKGSVVRITCSTKWAGVFTTQV